MRYHYVLTVEVPGVGITTAAETIDLAPGHKRSAVHRAAVEVAVRGLLKGAPPEAEFTAPIVRFWSLDPETLD
ncbi:hypothetical protein ABZ135_37405 [Streptomyces sp. NPDC006339]|uniref:hypothetical protein n=1 Tax=Streptomyces sp. NPDC006339 TaxID=3156755 RepID=UPI0033AD3998